MFRRIFELEEGFTTTSAETNQKLGTYYTQSLPNSLPTGDSNLNLNQLTNTAAVTGAAGNLGVNREPVLPNNYATYGVSPDLIRSREAACANPGSARDRFDHLTNLANSQDPASQVRCGWMYNNTDPQRGTGAFGISEGPFTSQATGSWMWDLQEAKKKVHIDLCRRVKDCGDIDAYPYQGRCGFCRTSGKAIPIVNGKVAYPSEPIANCSPNQIITSAGNCPRIDSFTIMTPEGQASRQVCDPLANGSLTRDCLIQKVRQAGCSDDGTLVTALKSGSDTNYLDTLKTNQAYNVYQSRAAIPMNDTTLRTGRLTVSQALTEFTRLSDQAASSANTGLAFAARDLCLNAGTIDTFDFCTEIADSTRPPFSVDCLQKEFLRAGGQRSGGLFPTDTNIVKEWNSLNTWRDVKQKIQKLKSETESTDRPTQEAAMMNFLGVKLDEKSEAPFAGETGCEIFYFSHNWRKGGQTIPEENHLFLGRRVQSSIPLVNNDLGIRGNAGEVSPNWGKSFVYITNLKVPTTKEYKIDVTGDDGFATTLNRPFVDTKTGQGLTIGRKVSTSNEISFVNYFPPTTLSGLWNLKSNGSNIVKGFWFQGGWGLFYSFTMDGKNTTSANVSLTQEAYAPMLNFEPVSESDKFMYGLDFFFGDKRLGDLQIKWATAFGAPTIKTPSATQNLAYGFKKEKMLLDLVGSRVYCKTRVKMTSFVTYSTCCIFNSVPNNAANVTANWHFLSSNEGSLASFQIRTYGVGDYKTGQLAMRFDYQSPQEVGGERFRIVAGVPYLVMIRIIKSGETFTGMELCLGVLNDIQADPKKLIVSQRINFPNPSRFENINSGEGRVCIVQGETPMSVAWVRMYDYYLDGDNLKREALDNWLGLYK